MSRSSTPSSTPPAARELRINDATSVGRAGLILAAMIAVSRVLGMARLVVATTFFGRGLETDAYNAAFNIPDTLAILISGGLLATGFVPVFTGYLRQGQTEAAGRTFRALLTLMLVGFGGVSLLLFGLTFTPLAAIMAPPGQVELFALILRILLFAQFLFVIGGVFSGTFNALRLFWFPALQPVFYNGGMIVGGVVGHKLGLGIESQAWGALGGAFAGTVLLLAPAALKNGLSLRPLWDLADEGVRRVMASLLPIFLGLASGQIIALNLPKFFGKLFVVGTVTSLDSANRIMQVPLDVLASSAAVALLPTLSRLFLEEKPLELRAELGKALQKALGLMFFAGAMLVALAWPVVHLIYEHGRFLPHDSQVTATILRCYAFCLPALGAQQFLARGFYATGRSTKPIGIGFIAMALFFVFGAIGALAPLPEGAALPLAAAVSTSILSLMQWRALKQEIGAFAPPDFTKTTALQITIAAFAGIGAWVASSVGAGLLAPFDTDLTAQITKLAVRALIFGVGAATGSAIWIALSKIAGLSNWKAQS